MKTDNESERLRLASLRAYENKYFEKGYTYVAGVDECGRGCLAGPVAAAAVILPPECDIIGVNDSKLLSPKRREVLCDEITKNALAVQFALVEAEIIDEINILQAALRAMGEALRKLPLKPEAALIDGTFLPDIKDMAIELEPVPGGDRKSVSVAAASIVAKVWRDKLMVQYAESYPEYGFDKHKGYGTPAHYAALAKYGPCPIHRRSFRLK